MSKRITKVLPLHVLPNQHKHPRVGDHVMIGMTNPATLENEWRTASVVQSAPARHDDQQYRFKWQLVVLPSNSASISIGWTNENQRVNTRDSKCDTRVDTHTSFDFVRHCDILAINKYDVERQLYHTLSGTVLNTAATTRTALKTVPPPAAPPPESSTTSISAPTTTAPTAPSAPTTTTTTTTTAPPPLTTTTTAPSPPSTSTTSAPPAPPPLPPLPTTTTTTPSSTLTTLEENNVFLCYVCDLEIPAAETATAQWMRCCYQPRHRKCDDQSLIYKKATQHRKVEGEQKQSPTTTTTNADPVSFLCPLCDCCIPRSSQENHEAALQMALKGNAVAFHELAMNYILGVPSAKVEINYDMGEMLLRKIVEDKSLPLNQTGAAYHELGLLYSDESKVPFNPSANKERLSIKERRALCKSFWEAAVKCGHVNSQRELDFHRLVSEKRAKELDDAYERRKEKLPKEKWKRGTPFKNKVVEEWKYCTNNHPMNLYEVPTETEAPLLYGIVVPTAVEESGETKESKESKETTAAAAAAAAPTTPPDKKKKKHNKSKRGKKNKKNNEDDDSTTVSPITCNVCHKSLKQGSLCYGCDACEYDMCVRCEKVKKKEVIANKKRNEKRTTKKDKKKAKSLGISYKEYLIIKKKETDAVERAEREKNEAIAAVAKGELKREQQRVNKRRNQERIANYPFSCQAFDLDRYAGHYKILIDDNGVQEGDHIRIEFDNVTLESEPVAIQCPSNETLASSNRIIVVGIPEHLDIPSTKAFDFNENTKKLETFKVQVPDGLKVGDRFRVKFPNNKFVVCVCPTDKVLQHCVNRVYTCNMRDIVRNPQLKALPTVQAFDVDVQGKGTCKFKVPHDLAVGEELAIVLPDGATQYVTSTAKDKLTKDRVVSVRYAEEEDDSGGGGGGGGETNHNTPAKHQQHQKMKPSMPAAKVLDFDCEGGSGVRVKIPEGLVENDQFLIEMKNGTFLLDTNGKQRVVTCPSNKKLQKHKDGGDRIISILYVEKKKKTRKPGAPYEANVFDIHRAAGTYKVKVPKGIAPGGTLRCVFQHDKATQWIYANGEKGVKYMDIRITKLHKKRKVLTRRLPSDMNYVEATAVYHEDKRGVVKVRVPTACKEGDRFRVIYDSGRRYCIVTCPTDSRVNYAQNRTLELRFSKDPQEQGEVEETDNEVYDDSLPQVQAFDVDVEEKGMLKFKVPKDLSVGQKFAIVLPDGSKRFCKCPSDNKLSKDRVVSLHYDDDALPRVKAFDVDVPRIGMLKFKAPKDFSAGQRFALVLPDGKQLICACPSDSEMKKYKDRIVTTQYAEDPNAEKAYDYNFQEKTFKVDVSANVKPGEKFSITFLDGTRYCHWECPPNATLKGEEGEGEVKTPNRSVGAQRTLVVTFAELEKALAVQLFEEMWSSLPPPKNTCTSCGKIEDVAHPLKVCTCAAARYCPSKGHTCQRAHWKEHKKLCKKMSTPEAVEARKVAEETLTAATKVEKKKTKEAAEKQAKNEVMLITLQEQIALTKQKKTMQGRQLRIGKATQCKEVGNRLFKGKKFEQAASQYRTAHLHLWEASEEDSSAVKGLRVACLSNFAQCMLKLRNYEQAVKSCSQALDVNKVHEKTLYRRGLAYIQLQRYAAAKKDLHRALVLDPTNQKTLKQLELLPDLVAKLQERNKNAAVENVIPEERKTLEETQVMLEKLEKLEKLESRRKQQLLETQRLLEKAALQKEALRKSKISKEQGNTAFGDKSYEKALALYTTAFENDSTNPAIVSNLALTCLKLNQHEEAVAYCDTGCKLLKHTPNKALEVKLRYRRATALVEMGGESLTDALIDFQLIVQMEPNNKKAQAGVASVEAAIAVYQAASEDKEEIYNF